MKNDEINRLVHKAEYTDDPDELQKITEELTILSAWDLADWVKHKMDRIEQEAAAEVWK